MNVATSPLDEAALWATLRAAGPLSAADQAAFDAWLDANPANAAALQQVDLSLLSLAAVASSPELLAMRGAALERGRKQARSRWTRRVGLGRVLAVAAAVVLIVAGLSSAFVLTPSTYATGIGERRVVALEDGSRISLDASTRVRVRYLGGERRLWLEEGRAKFDVAHNPLRPFSVGAGGRTVVATGTSFSVEIADRALRVVLYEGSVAVLGADRTPEHAVRATPRLRPGQELITDLDRGGDAATETVDPVRARAWEGGQLVFDDEALAVAVTRVNRYARTPIVLSANTPDDLRVSGVFNADDTEAFIDGVTAILPLRRSQSEEAILLGLDQNAVSETNGAVEAAP